MGNRAEIIFHDADSYSPTVYLHWNGSDVPNLLAKLRATMVGRGGDIHYAPARFVGICHETVPGNLSLGIENTEGVPDIDAPAAEWAGRGPGDAGIFLVDLRTWTCRRVGAWSWNECEADETFTIPAPDAERGLGKA